MPKKDMKMFLSLSGGFVLFFFFPEMTSLMLNIFSPHYKQNLFGSNKFAPQFVEKRKLSEREMPSEQSLGWQFASFLFFFLGSYQVVVSVSLGERYNIKWVLVQDTSLFAVHAWEGSVFVNPAPKTPPVNMIKGMNWLVNVNLILLAKSMYIF